MAYNVEQVVDFTPLLQLAPSEPTLLASLGLFEVNHERTTLVSVGRDVDSAGLIPARNRGGERNWDTRTDVSRKVFEIPFFPLDHNITAQDIQSLRSYGAVGFTDELRSQEEVVDRYMASIARKQAFTKEMIYSAAVQGYAYNGTGGSLNANYNWYDQWGQTQKTIEIDFTSTTVDPSEVIEAEGRAYIEDTKQDGTTMTRVFCLCGRNFFAAMIHNPFLRSAYQFYQGTPNPLRDRIGGDMDVRIFEFEGVTYMTDPYGYVATDEAFLFPEGIPGMFQSFYAPADDLQYANSVAQEGYVWMINQGRTLSLQTEFSLLAVNSRPELVVKLTMAS